LAERRGIPHHVLDVWDVTETASVAEFQRLARATADRVLERGGIPVLVGGSGLYVRAVLDDLEFPGSDSTLRSRLERELSTLGPRVLHERLRRVDPEAAARILSTNGRRIVRALEVVELTGRPFTASLPQPRYVYDAVQIGLDVPRSRLDERIARRVERMWAEGFVEEVRRLEKQGLRGGRTASRALGYAQVLRFLAGEWTEGEALQETIRATRRFARRQDSWFRRDPRVHWLTYDRGDLLDTALAVLAR
jgi:tRNA dimethylallyltransferase